MHALDVLERRPEEDQEAGKVYKGRIADWKLSEKWRWRSERRMKLWLQGPKQRLAECVQRRGEEVLLQKDPGQHRKRRSILVKFIQHSENSLTKLMVTRQPGIQRSHRRLRLWVRSFLSCFGTAGFLSFYFQDWWQLDDFDVSMIAWG